MREFTSVDIFVLSSNRNEYVHRTVNPGAPKSLVYEIPRADGSFTVTSTISISDWMSGSLFRG